ncbi:hypothetical protein BSZ07_03680 [Streptomyces sp. M1013]|nr:hypothetical protein BSZ07_03680 [Streptomyces sp. M1013]
MVDGQGIPLAASLIGGNRGRRHPTRAAARQDPSRRLLWQRGIHPVIAKRDDPHGTGLGVFRYVAERTTAWLHGFRRLRIRWERRDDIHEAFLGLAVCMITHRHVERLR